MRELYIVGGGGFSTELLFVIERIQFVQKKWDKIFIVDDYFPKPKSIRSYTVFGNFDQLLEINNPIDVIISVNDCQGRENITKKLKNSGNSMSFPNIIDTSAICDFDHLEIGEGNIIMHNTILSTNLRIGDFNIINSYTGIGHDTKIGDFNTFNPRVAISGKVVIGNSNNFGLNSAILQNKKVGSNNEIWYGTTVTRNIHDGAKYFGSPAKKIAI